jgi:hypothetical protein
MSKKNKTNKYHPEYTKAEIIAALGLRRVTRYSDGARVWISADGKEYTSIKEASNDLPQKEGAK